MILRSTNLILEIISSTRGNQLLCFKQVVIKGTLRWLNRKDLSLKLKRAYKEVIISSSILNRKTWLFTELVIKQKSLKIIHILNESIFI